VQDRIQTIRRLFESITRLIRSNSE
jgi:hypothetical protein